MRDVGLSQANLQQMDVSANWLEMLSQKLGRYRQLGHPRSQLSIDNVDAFLKISRKPFLHNNCQHVPLITYNTSAST